MSATKRLSLSHKARQRPPSPPELPSPPSASATSQTKPQQNLEPGGVAQSLPVAGVLAACAASSAPDAAWLRSYLTRVLSATSGLDLTHGARSALIEQAVEIATSDEPDQHAVLALHGYLAASAFAPNSAVPLFTALLHSDVTSSTVYDARAREALARFATALHLPMCILLHAEAALAALVEELESNARTPDGTNIEAVGDDDHHNRRRRSLKWVKVGAAGVVGGLALGLSGGLMAPVLIPALSTVGLASVGGSLAALGSGGAVALGGIFGAAGAGVGAAAMAGRTGDVHDFSFEKCSAMHPGKNSLYDTARISPSMRQHDAAIPCTDDSEPNAGGLLVWEVLTSQDFAMVIPGLVSFLVGFRASGSDEISWLLPEERVEVGGLDKIGESRRRRTTGAVTVQDTGTFILRFVLQPGSWPANISYRVALVPPGKDPPLWVMEENEQQLREHNSNDARSLSMGIFIPGLIVDAKTGAYPGMFADQFLSTAAALEEYDIECFALRWDTDLLLELSNALRRLLGRMALSMAAQTGAKMVVPAVVGAVTLPVSIIGAIRTLIGNIWARTVSHAAECGYMLAAELASRSFGNRPVILAGYSAGAMVVFSCLRELARRNLVGIVHDACLIGAPCSADLSIWREIRSVVSGRLINVFNPHDWYLELYHRGTNLGAVAGTRSIQDPKGIANVDNYCLERGQVNDHLDYAKKVNEILKDVGIGDPESRRSWIKLEEFEENLREGVDPIARPGGCTDSADENMFRTPFGDSSDEVVLFKASDRRKRKPLRTAESN